MAYLGNMIKKRKIYRADPFSVIVRVLDGQREGHYEKPCDIERFNYDYMQDDSTARLTSQSFMSLKDTQNLDEIIPPESDTTTFQTMIKDEFVSQFGARYNQLEEDDY